MNALRPVHVASSPTGPFWHPPAMALEVVYPSPRAYGRRKDSTVYGSFSIVPPLFDEMGVEDLLAEPVRTKKPKSISGPGPGDAIKNLFRKDESGTSKAQKIAKRAMEVASGKAAAASPPPAPEVVYVPAPALSPTGMPAAVQFALIGSVALGLGFGVGFMLGRR